MARKDSCRIRQVLQPLMMVLAITALTSCGITAPRSDAGYANLDSPGMFDTYRTTTLSIGPTVLRFAAGDLDADPEIKALLKSLNGVRISIYELDRDSERVLLNLERLGRKLQGEHWAPVMLVHEDGERTQMFAKSSSQRIQGLTIVSQDDHEVTVINVMGEIDPAHFKDVMVALNVNDAPAARAASAN